LEEIDEGKVGHPAIRLGCQQIAPQLAGIQKLVDRPASAEALRRVGGVDRLDGFVTEDAPQDPPSPLVRAVAVHVVSVELVTLEPRYVDELARRQCLHDGANVRGDLLVEEIRLREGLRRRGEREDFRLPRQ
jgi:hypothetical protein